MKVYVVTEGQYPPYFVPKVFVDKGKAENYVKYHRRPGYEMSLVDVDTEDGYVEVASGFIRLEGEYRLFRNAEGRLVVRPKGSMRVSLAPDPKPNEAVLEKGGPSDLPYWNLTLIRYYPECAYTEELAKDSLRRVANEVCSQVENLSENGVSIGGIKAALNL